MPTHFAHTLFDQGEYLLHAWQPVLALTRQAQATGLALEQGIAQVRFEARDTPPGPVRTFAEDDPALRLRAVV